MASYNDEEIRAIFAKNLNSILNSRNKTQIEVATALDIKQSTFSSWCTGSKMPRMDKVQALADYFGIMKSDLIEEKPATSEGDGSLSDEHKQIIERFKNLSAKNKLKMLGYMDSLAEQDNQ